MAIFQFFKGVIHSIEDFNRETVPGFDSYEVPMDYGFLQNDNFHTPAVENRFVTIQIGDDTVEHCACDTNILKASEGDEVTIVFSGKKIVAIFNNEEGYYSFYKGPLYRKFTLPKVIVGINMAIAGAIIGYIIHLIALKLRAPLFQMITEGATMLFLVGGIIYSLYHHSAQGLVRKKIEKYIRQIEGL